MTILAQLLIAGGAIGLAWPMLSGSEEQAALTATAPSGESASAPQQPVPAASGAASGAASWAAETTLEREADGHFYADVLVNGAPVRMLVDTGATTIALTGDDAAAMGIAWNAHNLRHVAQGASGPIEGVHVTLAQVELDGFAARDVAAIVVPDGLPISLLGQSFLSTVDRLEITDGRMVMSN